MRPKLVVLVLFLALSSCTWFAPSLSIKPKILVPSSGYFAVDQAIEVDFNQKVDDQRLAATVSPLAAFTLQRAPLFIRLVPIESWDPDQVYTIQLLNLVSLSGGASVSWHKDFQTQTRLGIKSLLVDTQKLNSSSTISPLSQLSIDFNIAVGFQTQIMVNESILPDQSIKWSTDRMSATLSLTLRPYESYDISLSGPPRSLSGYLLTDAGPINFHTLGLVPSNGSGSGGQAQTPIQVVIENSNPSRPQTGLQKADIVYEYISEYSITRFTAVYFGAIPATIGPVRSCRMINPYLVEAYSAVTMCSGASDGTLHYLWGDGKTLPGLPINIESYDTGGHYFRVGYRFAPHNLYTSGARAATLRQQMPQGITPYIVDGPHSDVVLGDSASSISVPLHYVTWNFNGSDYLRYDHGAPFIDTLTGQVKAKNVILLHVPFHYTNWSENGCCAWSVWYDMTGEGPADIYSDGKVIHAIWHFGSSGQAYYANHQAPYFTDATGNLIRLNSGLTWIHVLGNGQTH